MKRLALFMAIVVVTYQSEMTNADTVSEVKKVVQESMEFSNRELKQDPMRLSKEGSLEFWSSGGLLTSINRDTRDNTFDSFKGEVKHIEVVVLIEGEAAIAQYYQEAVMKPKGSAAVPNYRTRVTQAFVKEDGSWKIRAAHWSPLVGGAGTSQTVVK